MARLSKGEINRLGDRIRANGGLTDDADRALLEQVLTEHMEILGRALQTVVDGVQPRFFVNPTPRLKSDRTLVEKLIREPGMELARVQDICGMRIVDDFTWDQQDRLAHEIEGLFERARRIDRRAEPRSGYRALHVVVTLNGRFVEIQIRTLLQDAWAQVFERLADIWGRQIRYGEPPDPPPEGSEETFESRRDIIEGLFQFSDVIAEYEDAVAELVEVELELDEMPEPETDEERDQLQAARQDFHDVKGRYEHTGQAMAERLEAMRTTIERLGKEVESEP